MTARDSILILISRYFSQFINIGIFFFAARKFSPESFSYLALATSLFAFFNFFSDLNFRTAHLIKMSEKKEKEELNVGFSTFLLIKIVLISVTSIVMIIVIFFQVQNQPSSLDPMQIQIIGIYFITSILTSIIIVFSFTLKSQLEIVKLQIPIFFNTFVVGTLKIIAIINNNFIFYNLSAIIGNLFMILLYLYYSKNYRLVSPSKSVFLEYLSIAVPLIIPGLISISTSNLGPFFFIQHYDQDILGVYYVIRNITLVLLIIQQSLSSLFLPSFSALIAERKIIKLKTTVQMVERYMLILWGIFTITAFIAAPIFIKLFFGEFYYIHGKNFLLFSIFVIFDWGLWAPYGSIILALEKNKLYLFFSLFGLLTTIITWIFLIPIIGLIALSIGPYIGYFMSIPVGRYVIHKEFGFGAPTKKIITLVTINLLFVAISVGITQLIAFELLILLIATFCVLVLYVFIIFIFKVITKEDFLYIRNIFNLKKFFNYIKENS